MELAGTDLLADPETVARILLIMAAQTVAQTTADELLEGYRYELVQGELRPMELAGRQRGCIAAQIGSCLGALIATPMQPRPASSLALRPMSALCRGNALRLPQKNEVFFGAPDLAVEVISPNERDREIRKKVSDWLRAGTRPHQRTAAVYRAPDDICLLNQFGLLVQTKHCWIRLLLDDHFFLNSLLYPSVELRLHKAIVAFQF